MVSGDWDVITWSLLAFVLIGLGIWLKERAHRLYGLVILAVSSGYLVLIAFNHLEGAARILTLIGMGVILILLGLAYTKNQEKLEKDSLVRKAQHSHGRAFSQRSFRRHIHQCIGLPSGPTACEACNPAACTCPAASTRTRMKCRRSPRLTSGTANTPGCAGNSKSVAPVSFKMPGRTSTRKVTIALTGLPGTPKAVPRSRPYTKGLPGLMRTFQKSSSPPSASSAGFTKS